MESLQINPALWAFPVSLILAIAVLIGIWSIGTYYKATKFYRIATGIPCAVILTLIMILFLIIEGTFGNEMHKTWLFVIPAIMFMFSLGLVTMRRIKNRSGLGFIMNHAGLFLVVWAMTFGSADYMESRMIIYKGGSENLGFMEDGGTMPLNFHIKLDNFRTEYYPDGTTPRQFYSDLSINDKKMTASVNSPVKYDGYMIYQSGYDVRNGSYTILQIVRDPWLWIVWTGIAMLAIGSLIMILKKI